MSEKRWSDISIAQARDDGIPIKEDDQRALALAEVAHDSPYLALQMVRSERDELRRELELLRAAMRRQKLVLCSECHLINPASAHSLNLCRRCL